MSRRPPIPSLPSSVDPAVRRAIEALTVAIASVSQSVSSIGSSETIIAAASEIVSYVLPGAIENLTVVGGFDTILLQWDSTGDYVEVFRAGVDDIGQAVKIGQSYTGFYPDIPPDSLSTATYYYWGRAVNVVGTGPFNAVAGTAASTADDPNHIIELLQDARWKPGRPIETNAYGYPASSNGYAYQATVGGFRGEVEPVWPLEIDAVVEDGEVTWRCAANMNLGNPFTLGMVDGEVRMLVRSAMFGEAVIGSLQLKDGIIDTAHIAQLDAAVVKTGVLEGVTIKSVNPSDPTRFSLLSDGDLVFYRGGAAYKYLKQIMTGIANSGTPYELTGLDRAPEVQVSMRSLRAFDKNYVDQNQRWSVYHTGIVNNGGGSYSFTPVCQLIIDAGVASDGIDDSASQSENIFVSGLYATPSSTQKITISGTLNSIRGTGTVNNYYYRRCTVTLYYRVTAIGGAWSGWAALVVADGGDLTTDAFQIDTGIITANAYDYCLEFYWQDLGGTFTLGATSYDYAEVTKSNLVTFDEAFASAALGNTVTSSKTATLPSYTPPAGWEIYSVDYTIEYAYYGTAYSTGCRASGSGIPSGTYLFSISGPASIVNPAGYPYPKYNTKDWSGTAYATSFGYTAVAVSQSPGNAVAKIKYRNFSAVIKIRKPQTNSTTPTNSVNLTGAAFDLASAVVIDNSGVVNWIAIA